MSLLIQGVLITVIVQQSASDFTEEGKVKEDEASLEVVAKVIAAEVGSSWSCRTSSLLPLCLQFFH